MQKELQERRNKPEMLTALRREMKKVRGFSVESIGDIAIIMSNRGKLFKLHGAMLTLGILMDAIEAGTIALWRASGIWMPFAAGMCIVAGLGVWISVLYCRHTAYICPQRHETFTPKFKARAIRRKAGGLRPQRNVRGGLCRRSGIQKRKSASVTAVTDASFHFDTAALPVPAAAAFSASSKSRSRRSGRT